MIEEKKETMFSYDSFHHVDWKQTTAGCGNSKHSTPMFFGSSDDAAESQMRHAIDTHLEKHKEPDVDSCQPQIFLDCWWTES